MRDLQDRPAAEYEIERAKVATEGWGARLLAEQQIDGRWAGGYYTPKWTSTFYTMQLLWHLGVPPGNPKAARAVEVLLEGGSATDGGIRLAGRHPYRARLGEVCESGMGLAMSAWFLPEEPRLPALRDNLLSEQFADGGWNCQRSAGHSSFNTTVLVLEGLLEWERQRGPDPNVTAARLRGHEFMLAHRMFRSHRSGEVISPQYLMLSFPGRWHYDILRGLDYLAMAGAEQDERASEAIAVLQKKQRRDGAWPLQHRHGGKTYFEMEEAAQPSRWNTLRALRVLRWWEGSIPPHC